VLWANLNLLFWLSLFPFGTAWMGQTNFATWPVVIYGIDLLLAAVAYSILVRALLTLHGRHSTLMAAIGNDFKGKASILIYIVAILLALVNSWLTFAIYVVVAAMWFVPDKRIEKVLEH
jgi:uncharacterized membrane protein